MTLITSFVLFFVVDELTKMKDYHNILFVMKQIAKGRYANIYFDYQFKYFINNIHIVLNYYI